MTRFIEKFYTLAIIFGAALLLGISSEAFSAIDIIYSGNIQGRLEPCGCPGGETMGGLSRRAAKIREIRKSHDQVIVVDAGNSFYDVKQKKLLSDCQFDLKTKKFVEIFQSIGIDAVNIGYEDLKLGWQNLLEHIRSYKLPAISTNITIADSQIIKPYKIITKGDEKIGILGLCRLETDKVPEGFKIISLEEALSEYIEVLQTSGCNYILLLSDLNEEDIDVLIRKFPAINFVINSNPKLDLSDLRKTVNGKEVMATRERGQGIGLIVDAGYRYEYFELNDLTPSDGEINKKIEHYKNIELVKECVEFDPTNRTYTTSLSCVACHQKEYKRWKMTNHAAAYESLYKGYNEKNPVCIGCHTTGYRKEGGYTSNTKIGNLKNVQCETCHGSGKWHAWLDGDPAHIEKKVGEVVCRQCHDEERSPGFVYNDYNDLVRCSVSHQLKASAEFDFKKNVTVLGFQLNNFDKDGNLEFKIGQKSRLHIEENNSALDFIKKEFSLSDISEVKNGTYTEIPDLNLKFKKTGGSGSEENIRFKLSYVYLTGESSRNNSYTFTVAVPQRTVEITVDTNVEANIYIFKESEEDGDIPRNLVSKSGKYKSNTQMGAIVHILNDNLGIDDYFILDKSPQEGLTYGEKGFLVKKEYKGEVFIQAISGGYKSAWIHCVACNKENKNRTLPAMYTLPAGEYRLNFSRDKDNLSPVGQCMIKVKSGKTLTYNENSPLKLTDTTPLK